MTQMAVWFDMPCKPCHSQPVQESTTKQRFDGSKIREARHAAGFTQAALAHAINTRERNIIRWENDQHEPRFEHVAAIAKATGQPLDFFLAEVPEDPDAFPAEAV